MGLKEIVLILFVVILIAGGLTFLFLLKKGATAKVAEAKGPTAAPSTTQAFLPFEDIVNSMIVLPNHEYRMVVECSSINYFLKTEDEQDAVELSFRRFLNSLKFPFSFYIQTREIDNREIINTLKGDISQVLKSFPQLREYAQNYAGELEGLNERLQNNKFKKKFIIVTFDEAVRMTNMTDAEKMDYALNELIGRCNIVIGGLANIGIKGKILRTDEVANLVYQSMHKEVGGITEDMMDGSYMSLSVNGNTYQADSPLATIDSILLEFENKLNTEVLNNPNAKQEYKSIANKLIADAEKQRSFAGAYFRSNQGGNLNEEE